MPPAYKNIAPVVCFPHCACIIVKNIGCRRAVCSLFASCGNFHTAWVKLVRFSCRSSAYSTGCKTRQENAITADNTKATSFLGVDFAIKFILSLNSLTTYLLNIPKIFKMNGNCSWKSEIWLTIFFLITQIITQKTYYTHNYHNTSGFWVQVL